MGIYTCRVLRALYWEHITRCMQHRQYKDADGPTFTLHHGHMLHACKKCQELYRRDTAHARLAIQVMLIKAIMTLIAIQCSNAISST